MRQKGPSWVRKFSVPVGALLIATALDYTAPGFRGWPIAVLILPPVLVWTAISMSRARVLGLTLTLVWLVVLPAIPWHAYKRFYIACARLEPGTPLGEVRQRMAPYHLQYDAEEEGAGKLSELAMTLHPSLDRSADWCRVFGSGTVDRVEILPD